MTILKKANYVNGYQQAADRLSGVKATYIMANHSTRANKDMPWAGPFYLYVTPALEKWSGLEVRQLPTQLKPSYWWYCLRSLEVLHKLKLSLYIAYKRYLAKR